MADWYGTSRSNYFEVKDKDEFVKFLNQYEATLIEKEDLVGFYSKTYKGDIPTRYPEDDDFADPISIVDEIHKHLTDNSICVIMEAGSEKARYITGNAIAISANDERVDISLTQIYKLAQEAFGSDMMITEATY